MRKVALVVGAGKCLGVGAATAKKLAAHGYDIALNFLSNEQNATNIAAECATQGASTKIFQGDISNPTQAGQVIQKTLDRFSRLDAVVYSAGVTKFATYDDLNLLNADDFNRIFTVNCFGAYFIAASAKEALMKSQGSFTAISSTAGFTGIGSSIAYAASKGALNTLILALAKAMAPIRVNAIAPSFIDSSWWEERFANNPEKYAAFKASMTEKTTLGTVITPDEVAKCVLYLSESQITGEILRLDAGAHLKA